MCFSFLHNVFFNLFPSCNELSMITTYLYGSSGKVFAIFVKFLTKNNKFY